MMQTKTRISIDDLIKLMTGLEALHGDLTVLVERKIDAMRRADVEGLTELGAKEVALTQRLRERDAMRRQVLERIGKELGQTPARARTLTVTQLTAHLDAAQCAQLMDAARKLRAAVFKSARVSRLAGAIARDVLDHMRWVFASVRPKGQSSSEFGGARMEHRILDAVG